MASLARASVRFKTALCLSMFGMLLPVTLRAQDVPVVTRPTEPESVPASTAPADPATLPNLDSLVSSVLEAQDSPKPETGGVAPTASTTLPAPTDVPAGITIPSLTGGAVFRSAEPTGPVPPNPVPPNPVPPSPAATNPGTPDTMLRGPEPVPPLDIPAPVALPSVPTTSGNNLPPPALNTPLVSGPAPNPAIQLPATSPSGPAAPVVITPPVESEPPKAVTPSPLPMPPVPQPPVTLPTATVPPATVPQVTVPPTVQTPVPAPAPVIVPPVFVPPVVFPAVVPAPPEPQPVPDLPAPPINTSPAPVPQTVEPTPIPETPADSDDGPDEAPSTVLPPSQPEVARPGVSQEEQIESAYRRSQASKGRMDGAWIVTANSGQSLYRLQLVEPGRSSPLEGAWSDPRTPAAIGSRGLIDEVSVSGDDIRIRIHRRTGQVVLTVKWTSGGTLSGEVHELGHQTRITMTRP